VTFSSKSLRSIKTEKIQKVRKSPGVRRVLSRAAILVETGSHWSPSTAKAYVSAEREAEFKAPGKVWGVMRKAPRGGKLDPHDERTNRIIAMVRAKVEHPFRVLKRQFGYMKTRYRGLAKNRAQLFTLFALGNLFLVRRRLMT
jgi:hypothetical protein